MESETEERLKEKYVMVPRGEEETAAGEGGASQSKLGASGTRVGDPDGPGFSVGQAPSASKGPPFARSKVAGKTRAKPANRITSPSPSGEESKPWRKPAGA